MLPAMLMLAGLSGCAYEGSGALDEHFNAYKARMPYLDTVYVCSAYGCRTQSRFTFTQADLEKLKQMMAPAKNGAADERKAVQATLAWMEKRVGDVVGTSADRPGDDVQGVGDPTQMDCVDVATNLMSYLLILERHKLLAHHKVGPIYVKEDFRRGFSGWTHYAAVLVEHNAGQKWAVDGWLLASGQPPEVVETERWYIDDKDILFGATRTPRVPVKR